MSVKGQYEHHGIIDLHGVLADWARAKIDMLQEVTGLDLTDYTGRLDVASGIKFPKLADRRRVGVVTMAAVRKANQRVLDNYLDLVQPVKGAVEAMHELAIQGICSHVKSTCGGLPVAKAIGWLNKHGVAYATATTGDDDKRHPMAVFGLDDDLPKVQAMMKGRMKMVILFGPLNRNVRPSYKPEWLRRASFWEEAKPLIMECVR